MIDSQFILSCLLGRNNCLRTHFEGRFGHKCHKRRFQIKPNPYILVLLNLLDYY